MTAAGSADYHGPKYESMYIMGVYRKNNVYYIDYYLANGRRKRKRIGTSKKAAERVLHKIRTDIIEGKYLDVQRNKKRRLKEYSESYLEDYCKHNKKSWVDDRTHFRQFIDFVGNIYIDEITVQKFEAFRKHRFAMGMKRSTVNRALASIKTMLNRAVAQKDLRENPIARIKHYKENNERIRYLEKEELERLLQCCPERTRNVVIFATNTGMRKAEIFNLTWSAIDFTNGLIFVNKSKTDERRSIPMTEPAKVLLMNLKEHSQSEYVFCNNKGQKLNGVRKSFVNAVKKAGIKDFTFHDLRHTFASYLKMEGVDLYVIKELLGHKRIEMTMRYTHICDEQKANDISKLDHHFQSIQTSLPKQLSYSDVISVST